ncbi:(R)-1-hydroxy-2-aminoethylphosphonate ammonia-lyase [Desulfospira joergensenii]|uniref:(R)-1-hydroxy-2-aminoethylphosphonate ammonia-lyase n=1 Tax=Desulfospira joergensenii TaxID=53329 RepID=UPI0003B34CD5|nr:aspartate aminotransferase family protein [Desulfospira joergensenii]
MTAGTQGPPTRFDMEQGDVNTTKNRERYWARNLSDRARDVFERDKQYFLHQNLSTPVLNVLAGASGIYIEDMDGRRYMDMHGNGVHNAGFNHPKIVQAVKDQLDRGLSFCPRRYTNKPAVDLAQKLAHITPDGLEKSLFCPGGSEAVEMALTLAKQITGNFKTISFWDSFHGAGFAAASIGGEALFKTGMGPMMPGAMHVEFPNYYRNPWGFDSPDPVDEACLNQVKTIFERQPGIAAVIGEPISATPVVPSRAYWEEIRELCRQYGALLIFDEIIEGFGRTGKMFACEHFITPDILVLGKSLGGGLLPFAGMITRSDYDRLSHLSVGHYTHEKNSLCAAAALAEIRCIEDQNLADNAARIGKLALERLEELKEKHDLIGNIAGLGLHMGIDLVKDPFTKERAVEEAEIIMYKAMEKGLAFKTIEGNIITLRPALTITPEEMSRAIDILDECITETEQEISY